MDRGNLKINNKIVFMNNSSFILGVLFDNAVEAVTEEALKTVIVRIEEKEEFLYIEDANNSYVYLNNEIERFCVSVKSHSVYKHRDFNPFALVVSSSE